MLPDLVVKAEEAAAEEAEDEAADNVEEAEEDP